MNTEVAQSAIPKTVDVQQPNMPALLLTASQFEEAANAITITDTLSLAAAAKALTENKAEQKRLDEERQSFVRPLNDVVKALNAKYKPLNDMLVACEGIIKKKIGAYQQKVEDERRKAEAEAEDKANKERAKLEKRAESAEEKGQDEKADALREQAASVVAAVPAAPAVKVAGISSRETWTAEVTDIQKVCKLIADGVLPVSLIQFKPAELNRIATQWKNTRAFDGIKITKSIGIAARS